MTDTTMTAAPVRPGRPGPGARQLAFLRPAGPSPGAAPPARPAPPERGQPRSDGEAAHIHWGKSAQTDSGRAGPGPGSGRRRGDVGGGTWILGLGHGAALWAPGGPWRARPLGAGRLGGGGPPVLGAGPGNRGPRRDRGAVRPCR